MQKLLKSLKNRRTAGFPNGFATQNCYTIRTARLR